MPKTTPECDKLAAAEPGRRAIQDFLDWAQSKGLALGSAHRHDETCYTPHEHSNSNTRCLWFDESNQSCPKLDRVCAVPDGAFVLPMQRRDALVMEFLGVDEAALERERRALLQGARER